MSSGFATVSLGPTPLSNRAEFVGVYRYFPDEISGERTLEYLPHVTVLEIEQREGPHPGLARFRYRLSVGDGESYPRTFEEALSVEGGLPGIVRNDERLVVCTLNPDGTRDFLFDGFSQVPEMSLSSNLEDVRFSAYGVAVRSWDEQIGGAKFRDADDPALESDHSTSLEVRFNPGGRPNAIPAMAEPSRNSSGRPYPTFIDPLAANSADSGRFWTLASAVKYICYHHNSDEEFVLNPTETELDTLLDRWSARSEASIDPQNPESYSTNPVELADFIATGTAWPDALASILEPEGFGMAFRLETSSSSRPITRLEIFRRSGPPHPGVKDLLLQPRGAVLDPGRTNLAEAELARDVSEVANEFVVDLAPTRYEASFVLCPAFSIDPSDCDSIEALSAFALTHPDFPENRNKYRLFVFDETGDGHWDWESSTISTTSTSMESLYEGGERVSHLRRRRPPIAELFSRDADGRAMTAALSISTDYLGDQPGIWDGTGNWQRIGGGFDLLDDRLGIWINVPHPNGWNIQTGASSGIAFPSGVVGVVEELAKPGGRRFALRLTCVIEGDFAAEARAVRRGSSSTNFSITRRIDGRRRYRRHIITSASEFNDASEPLVARDDTAKALREAENERRERESGKVAGRVTIPRFTRAYRIGDRIRGVRGRGLSLRTNAGAPIDEGEVLPAVIGLRWAFDGERSTTLLLSDDRGADS